MPVALTIGAGKSKLKVTYIYTYSFAQEILQINPKNILNLSNIYEPFSRNQNCPARNSICDLK